VFIGAGAAAVVGDGVGLPGIAAIAFAHGLTIMVFAFAYGPVSGGHMNPAVTVGVLAAGAMRAGEAAGYIVSQLAGGIIGALLLRAVLGGAATGLGAPALAHNLALGATTVTVTPAAGFVIEAVLAFFLVTVVLSTAVAGSAGNLAPLAIGMTLTLNIIMGGVLTGAAFNPARAISNASYMKVTQKPRGTARFRRYELVSVTPRSLSLLRGREEITAARPPPSRRDLPSSRLSSQAQRDDDGSVGNQLVQYPEQLGRQRNAGMNDARKYYRPAG
jgi:glycerol uptake facilitator-like aquaporin